ncbi:IS30 family transposase, partial [Staphylococcus aureus]
EIETQDFDIEHLATAIRKVETSTLGEESENDFIGLFSDMDLSSTRLGNNVKERTALISKVMVNLDDLPFVHSDMEIDMLGDAYEFLIGRFAATAGKKALPSHIFKSITFDCGKEFSNWKTICNCHDISIFFADPGTPSQRGLNEHSNGILRRSGLDKELDFNLVTDDHIISVAQKINHRPRKSLGYRTPLEV